MSWSDENLAALERMSHAGASNAEIGRVVGLTKHAVRNKRRELGLPQLEPFGIPDRVAELPDLATAAAILRERMIALDERLRAASSRVCLDAVVMVGGA